MKTIEIISGDQKALFTTKSVTFDGKEFLYSHMTNVIHSSEKHIYTFTYDGEVQLLPYDEKDEKTLNAIFSQVQKLTANKKTASSASGSEETTTDSKTDAAPKDGDEAAKAQKESDKPAANETEGEKPEDEAKASEKKSEDTKAPAEEASKDASVNVTDVLGKSKSKKADKKGDGTKPEAEKPEEDPEKKARRSKSLKIFCIILAVLLVCSIAYYYIFGTKTAPAPSNPNTTESQQYDDIDQLIDDLQ